MNSEKNNNGRGIFYGVIGVATLVVAIIGATFAYFTASQASNNGDITGNAASVSFGLRVEREETTDQTNGGLIPMSNSMVQSAVNGGGFLASDTTNATRLTCVDDNHNSVCQIYKVTVYNTSSAALFLDGYISLTGGLSTSSVSTDVTDNPTVMRWAQVFKGTASTNTTAYSTGTDDTKNLLGASNTIAIAPIGTGSVNDGQNRSNIYTDGETTGTVDVDDVYSAAGATINGNAMPAIIGNYIRTSANGSSDVSSGTQHVYDREELADALVFDMLVPVGQSKELYFVVWLHETGTKQNPTGAEEAPTEDKFFGGTVTFQSGQGGEVTATFSSVAKVASSGT